MYQNFAYITIRIIEMARVYCCQTNTILPELYKKTDKQSRHRACCGICDFVLAYKLPGGPKMVQFFCTP